MEDPAWIEWWIRISQVLSQFSFDAAGGFEFTFAGNQSDLALTTPAIILRRDDTPTTSTMAGPGINFKGKSDTGTLQSIVRIESSWLNTANSNLVANLEFRLFDLISASLEQDSTAIVNPRFTVGDPTSNLANLHVMRKFGAGASGVASGLIGYFESQDACVISLAAGTGSVEASIYFGDNSDASIGKIRYLNSSNAFEFTTNSALGLTITSAQSVVSGALAALATNATDGFLYIPTSAGAPTGTPTAFTGKVAMEFDTTNNRLYIYDGAWISVALA
jgi:hypothetical protein